MAQPEPAAKGRCRIRYITIVRWVYYVTTALFVFDRLFTNVFPRQAFKMKGYSTSSDKFDETYCTLTYLQHNSTFGGLGKCAQSLLRVKSKYDADTRDWTATVFDILARISGRVSIAATNGCLFSMLESFHVYLRRVAPSWVDMHDEHDDRRKFHIYCGWSVILSTLPHIWSAMLPVMFQSYGLKLQTGRPDWPGTERQSYSTVNSLDKVVTLGGDDIWRLIEMTILLGMVMPYTFYKLFKQNWPLGMKIHVFGAVAYLWDIIRRHSHPHSWIFNGPVFLWWVLDKTYAAYSYHKHVPVQCKRLSANYICAELGHFNSQEKSLAPLCWLRFPGSTKRPNPFTSFKNHLQLPLLGNDGKDWKLGFIIRVSQRPGSFTGTLAGENPKAGDVPKSDVFPACCTSPVPASVRTLNVKGAFASCYDRAVERVEQGLPAVIIASGSGAALAVDFIGWAMHRGRPVEREVHVAYTARDVGLFAFVVEIVKTMISKGPGLLPGLRITMSCTRKANDEGFDLDYQRRMHASSDSQLQLKQGRINFEEDILGQSPRDSSVFFCGAPLLAHLLKIECNKTGMELKSGHLFDQPGQQEIEDMALNWFREGHDEKLIQGQVRHLKEHAGIDFGQRPSYSDKDQEAARELRRLSVAAEGEIKRTRARAGSVIEAGIVVGGIVWDSLSTSKHRKVHAFDSDAKDVEPTDSSESDQGGRRNSATVMYDF